MNSNISPILIRELRSLIYSPIAYIVGTVFLLLAGYFWMVMLGGYVDASSMAMARGSQQPMLFQEYLIMPYAGNLAVTLMFIMPFVSMRFFAEEKRSGTIETLFTMPFSDLDILLGKYLAGLSLLGFLVALAGAYTLWVMPVADVHWPPVITAFVGLFLVGAVFLAAGTLCSSLTENQVVAAASTFGVCLMLFVLNWATSGKSGPIFDALAQLGIMEHFEGLGRGLVTIKDISYFLLFIIFLLFTDRKRVG